MTEKRDVVEALKSEHREGGVTFATLNATVKEIETLRKAEKIFLAHIGRVEGELAAAKADMETWPGRLGDEPYVESYAARADKRMGSLEPVPEDARALVDDLRRAELPVDGDSAALRGAAASEIERTRNEIGWAKGRIVFLEEELFHKCQPELKRYQDRTQELERRLAGIRRMAKGQKP
jgi:chromosome segregation ATPase